MDPSGDVLSVVLPIFCCQACGHKLGFQRGGGAYPSRMLGGTFLLRNIQFFKTDSFFLRNYVTYNCLTFLREHTIYICLTVHEERSGKCK